MYTCEASTYLPRTMKNSLLSIGIIVFAMSLTSCTPPTPLSPTNQNTTVSQQESTPVNSQEHSIPSDKPEDVITAFYDNVNQKKYSAAYILWENEGKASGKTLEDFTKGYSETKSTDVTIVGTVSTEGAAGSIYATVPVSITAVTTTGKTQHFTGEYVLRKSNIEPKGWHIYSAKISQK